MAIAPDRALRPGASRAQIEPVTQEELDECPFCAGREDRTPPEVLRIPEHGDWLVRVVPNLYPAVERQEVVIHSPRHVRSFAQLTEEELTVVAEAWHQRSEEAWVTGYEYVHVLINEGRAAGSSLPHSHSQLVWLNERPPAVLAEEANLREGACALCELLERERRNDSLLIAERGGVALLAAYAGRLPYELLIAGEHWGRGEDGGIFLVRALELLADAMRRLHALEGLVPMNAWLHNSGHWHFEVVPRLTVLAGLELGAGIYVNSLDPAEAAERLRNA